MYLRGGAKKKNTVRIRAKKPRRSWSPLKTGRRMECEKKSSVQTRIRGKGGVQTGMGEVRETN